MILEEKQVLKQKTKHTIKLVQILLDKCNEDSNLVKDIVYYLYNTDSQIATEIRDELNYWIENGNNKED